MFDPTMKLEFVVDHDAAFNVAPQPSRASQYEVITTTKRLKRDSVTDGAV
jgi:hypothetical protein